MANGYFRVLFDERSVVQSSQRLAVAESQLEYLRLQAFLLAHTHLTDLLLVPRWMVILRIYGGAFFDTVHEVLGELIYLNKRHPLSDYHHFKKRARDVIVESTQGKIGNYLL